MTPAELAFAMERWATQLEDRFCGTKTCKECKSALRDAELLRAGAQAMREAEAMVYATVRLNTYSITLPEAT